MTRAITFLIFLGLLVSGSSLGQTIKDSEFKRLETNLQEQLEVKDFDSCYAIILQQKERAKRLESNYYNGYVYYNLANHYSLVSNKDSILFYVEKARKYLTNEPLSALQLDLQELYVNYCDLFEDSEESEKAANALKKMAEKFGNPTYIYIATRALAKERAKSAEYDDALTLLNKAEKMWDKLDKKDQISAKPPYSMFGYLNYKMENYEEVIIWGEKLIDYYIKIEDYWSAAQQCNNVASSYFRARNDSASFVSTLHRGISYAKKANFRYGVANASNQLADYYMYYNMLDSAGYYLQLINEYVPDIEELGFKALVLVTEARYATKIGNLSKAESKYTEALEIWNKLGDLRKEKQLADALVSLNKQMGDTQDALKYLEISYQLQMKLVDKEKIERVKEIELTEAFHQQQLKDSLTAEAERQELLYKNRQSEEQRITTRNYLLLGLLIVLLIAIGLYSAYKRKQKQSKVLADKNEIIETSLQEKQMLLKEIHHRVKNNFQIISDLLQMQFSKYQDEGMKELMAESENRIKSMGIIHQKLYQNDDLTLYFLEYVEEMVKEIQAMYASKKIACEYNIDKNITFDIDTIIPLALILNELLTNSFKYAFKEEKENKLVISLSTEGDHYVMTFHDNGLGIPELIDLKKAKSLGLRLIRRLSKQLHGQSIYQKNNGAEFKISFKDTEQRMLVD